MHIRSGAEGGARGDRNIKPFNVAPNVLKYSNITVTTPNRVVGSTALIV